MKPHKNFAICRSEFRTIVITQIDIDDIDDMLFKDSSSSLPSKSLFQIIKIDYDNINSNDGNNDENNHIDKK